MEIINTKDYKITRKTIQSYKLRHPSGLYWADINIDDDGESGRIQIASDFGSWQNYWSHCGKPFKDFLISLDQHYAANKFKANDHFDAEENLRSIKEYILQSRREEVFNEDDARELFDEVKNIEEECPDDVQYFYGLINNTKALYSIYYDGFSVVKTITPGFKAFWKSVWPAFIEELKQDRKPDIRFL